MLSYVFIMVFAAGVTSVASLAVWKVALKYRIYPEVRQRDMHSTPVPRLGGIAMLVAFMLALLLSSQFGFFSSFFAKSNLLFGILLAGLLISIVGLLDDLLDLHWAVKLVAQVLAAGAATVFGAKISLDSLLPPGAVEPGFLHALTLVLTVIILVVTMNAVNFIDGLDGLVAGVCLIANIAFFIYIYFFTRELSPHNFFSPAGLLAALTVGVCLGFLPFNWRPAKLFMGDSGSLLLGLLMGVEAMLVTSQATAVQSRYDLIPAFLPVLLPFAVMALPILDLVFAVIRRLSRGQSPFAADRKHLHHRLLQAGHSPLSAVLIFYAWTAIISLGLLMFFFANLELAWVTLLGGSALCLLLTLMPLLRGRRSSPRR